MGAVTQGFQLAGNVLNGSAKAGSFALRHKKKLMAGTAGVYAYPYVEPIARAAYNIYHWSKDNLGGFGTLLAGTAVGAIAIAAFSKTAKLIKKAALAAVLAGGLYLGASYLFNKSATGAAVAATGLGFSALGVENVFDLGQAWKTIKGNTVGKLSSVFSRLTNTAALGGLAPKVTTSLNGLAQPDIPNSDPLRIPDTEFSPSRIPAVPRQLVTPEVDSAPNVDTMRTPQVDVTTDVDTLRVPTQNTDSSRINVTTDKPVSTPDTPGKLTTPDVASEPPLVDTTPAAPIKTANVADDVTDFAQKEASMLSKISDSWTAIRAGKIGQHLPAIAGTAAVAGIGALLVRACDDQIDFATSLKEQGLIDEGGLDAYIAFNNKSKLKIGSDLAIGAADPTGASLIYTAKVEKDTYDDFKDWLDKHGALLSPDQAKALSMSIFTPDTVSKEIANEVQRNIPTSYAGQPKVLHGVIGARMELDNFLAENPYPGTHLAFDPTKPTSFEEIESMQSDWHQQQGEYMEGIRQEVAKLVSDPNSDSTRAYLSLYKPEDRLNLAVRLSKADENVSSYPELSAYLGAKETWNPLDDRRSKNAIIGDEESLTKLDDYIVGQLNRANVDTQQLTNPRPASRPTAPILAM